jgi:hypothetical protein
MIFNEIANRIMRLEDIENEGDLAAALGMAQSTFSERKKRGSIPFREIVSLCEKKEYNLHYVVFGKTRSKSMLKGLAAAENIETYGLDDDEYQIIELWRGATDFARGEAKGRLEASQKKANKSRKKRGA